MHGKPFTHFPRWKRVIRGLRTNGVVWALVLVVLGIIACIFVIKLAINASGLISYDFTGVVTSIMLSILILVLNDPFQLLAIRLVGLN